MPAPLPPELRERVVAHGEATGLGRILLGQIFNVGPATAYRWRKLLETTGSLAPRKPARSGPEPKISDDKLEDLRALVAEKPDRTLKELSACWLEREGVVVSIATMDRALERAGITLKKKPSGSPLARVPTSSKRKKPS